MTEDEREAKVAETYRGLAKPEPSARLDDAILAASRRAVRAGPRSSPMRRWTVPLSLAAAVVLSVLVTLRVQDEAPEIVSPVPSAPAPAVKPAPTAKDDVEVARAEPAKPASVEQPAKPASVEQPAKPASVPQPAPPASVVQPGQPARVAEAPRKQAVGVETRKAESVSPGVLPDAMRDAPRDESRLPKFSPDPGPVVAERRADAGPAPAAPAASAPSPAARPAPLGRMASQGAGSAAAPAGEAQDQVRERAAKNASVELAKRAEEAETPERQLERIAALRREGKHAEADRLLAEFRQRYPQYRIPEATLEKVLPPR